MKFFRYIEYLLNFPLWFLSNIIFRCIIMFEGFVVFAMMPSHLYLNKAAGVNAIAQYDHMLWFSLGIPLANACLSFLVSQMMRLKSEGAGRLLAFWAIPVFALNAALILGMSQAWSDILTISPTCACLAILATSSVTILLSAVLTVAPFHKPPSLRFE